MTNADNGVGHVQGKTGQATDSHDDTHAGAGDSHRNSGFSARYKGVTDILDAHTADGPKLSHYNGDHDSPEGAENHRLAAPDQHVKQEGDGDEQVAALLHYLSYPRQLVLGQAQQVILGGPHLYLDDNTQIIDQGRDHSRLDDLSILDAQGLCHNKGSGSHDRGQKLAAHRGGGLHRAGKLFAIASLFHQRDSKGAGSHHIGHSRAVDGAQETRGQHGHLGGAALCVTSQSVGDVIKELAHAALVHDFAKDDEQHNIGGGHLDGGAINSIDIGSQVSDDPVPGVTAVHEYAGERATEDGID